MSIEFKTFLLVDYYISIVLYSYSIVLCTKIAQKTNNNH